jgi:hypothetical protein
MEETETAAAVMIGTLAAVMVKMAAMTETVVAVTAEMVMVVITMAADNRYSGNDRGSSGRQQR